MTATTLRCVYIITWDWKFAKCWKQWQLDCDCDLRFFWEEAKRWTLHFTVKSVPMFSLMSDAPRQFSVFFVDVEVSHIKNERLTLPRRDRTSHSTNRPRPAYVPWVKIRRYLKDICQRKKIPSRQNYHIMSVAIAKETPRCTTATTFVWLKVVLQRNMFPQSHQSTWQWQSVRPRSSSSHAMLPFA